MLVHDPLFRSAPPCKMVMVVLQHDPMSAGTIPRWWWYKTHYLGLYDPTRLWWWWKTTQYLGLYHPTRRWWWKTTLCLCFAGGGRRPLWRWVSEHGWRVVLVVRNNLVTRPGPAAVDLIHASFMVSVWRWPRARLKCRSPGLPGAIQCHLGGLARCSPPHTSPEIDRSCSLSPRARTNMA